MTKILGISCFYHDSAACLVENGKILGAVQEERFTRKKHDSSFPINSIKYLLNEYNLSFIEIEKIIFYENSFLKFSRLISTYIHYSPKGFNSFVEAMSEWIGGKLFFKRNILKNLKKMDKNFNDISKIDFTDHHLSHAASAFYPSPFQNAAILTMDGVGEWSTATIGIGNENKINLNEEIRFPHSLGLLYSAFTYYLGFKVNSGEYKVMGLAPYGKPKYTNIIKDNLIDIKSDGSFRLNMEYFDFPVGFKMINKNFERLFNQKKRLGEKEKINQFHMDIAASIQDITEEIVLRICEYISKKFKIKNLCLAGGVALNCVANGKILNQNLFEEIWIQPAAGDAGGAIGAALNYFYNKKQNRRIIKSNSKSKDFMNNSYLGPKYENKIIKKILIENKIIFHELPFEKILDVTTDKIKSGDVVGWFRGRTEFGPRALGNRSIIADPRNENMQKKLNLKVKFRESFRPFAPVILENKLTEYFEMKKKSPYMLMVSKIKKEHRKKMNEREENLFGIEKLNIKRSSVPAVTHVDYTSRIQTINKENNKDFYCLIDLFYKKTGCPIIVNTSFNIRSEPIVNSPNDAIKCFLGTGIDMLVLEDFILYKNEQKSELLKSYKDSFELD